MKNILLFVAAIVLCYSCHSDQSDRAINRYFTPDSLPSQQITINTERDTTIQLSGGSTVSIPAHSLQGDSKTIQLEVREALTMSDMLLAGLSTKSNGRILQSGGMFYISPAGDQKVKILKPLAVTLPAKVVDTAMQLFRGVESDSGINWIDPQRIQENKPTALDAKDNSQLKDTGIVPIYATPSFYDFNISTFGWYNVDKYYGTNEVVLDGHLKAYIKTPVIDSPTVIFTIPVDKVLMFGYKNKKDGYFYFEDDKDGAIPIVADKDAFIIVIGKGKKGPVYGSTKFRTAAENNIEVTVDPISVKDLKEEMRYYDKAVNIQ